MNLYRSFGNLLEAYVADGGMYSADVLMLTEYSNVATPASTPASTPDIGINPRSESDDSGFEISISSPADSSPSSAGNPEPHPMSVPTDGEERSLTPSSTLTSALRSSVGSSMRSSVSSASFFLPVTDASAAPLTRDTSVSLQHRVEQALLKINPSWRKTRSASTLTRSDAQRRASKKSLSLPRRTTAVHIPRSESTPAQLLLRQAGHQRIDRQRRPVSLYHDMGLAEKPIEEGAEDPRDARGPGLTYLEEVCQMWEEIARLQIYNRQPRAETDVPEDRRDAP